MVKSPLGTDACAVQPPISGTEKSSGAESSPGTISNSAKTSSPADADTSALKVVSSAPMYPYGTVKPQGSYGFPPTGLGDAPKFVGVGSVVWAVAACGARRHTPIRTGAGKPIVNGWPHGAVRSRSRSRAEFFAQIAQREAYPGLGAAAGFLSPRSSERSAGLPESRLYSGAGRRSPIPGAAMTALNFDSLPRRALATARRQAARRP